MPKLMIYITLALMFGAGVLLGTMSVLPGKSEAHATLKQHGEILYSSEEYLFYYPDNAYLSTEEYESLTTVSGLYEHVDIVMPSSN